MEILAGLLNHMMWRADSFYHRQPHDQDKPIEPFQSPRPVPYPYLVDARKVLSRRTDANEDKPTGIISIVVTDRDPVRARDMAAAYVEESNKLIVEMDTSAAHRERLFLEQRLRDVESDLEASEEQFGHYSSRTGTMDENSESKAMLDAFATVQGELIAAQSDLSGLQSLYAPESARVVQAKARVAALSGGLEKLEGARGGEADKGQEYRHCGSCPCEVLLTLTCTGEPRRWKWLTNCLVGNLNQPKLKKRKESQA